MRHTGLWRGTGVHNLRLCEINIHGTIEYQNKRGLNNVNKRGSVSGSFGWCCDWFYMGVYRMSVLINGMEMPKSCRTCGISQPDGCGFFCPIIV